MSILDTNGAMACAECGRRARAVRDRLKAENAELRELVRDMWQFTGAACKKYPRLFDQSAQGGQMVMPNMLDSFEQRMRVLSTAMPEYVGELVRCKDCALYDREDGLCYRDPNHSGYYRPAHDDGFCAWAEKREDQR